MSALSYCRSVIAAGNRHSCSDRPTALAGDTRYLTWVHVAARCVSPSGAPGAGGGPSAGSAATWRHAATASRRGIGHSRPRLPGDGNLPAARRAAPPRALWGRDGVRRCPERFAIRSPQAGGGGRRKIMSARVPARHRVSLPVKASRQGRNVPLRRPENDYTKGRPGCPDAAGRGPGRSAPRSSPGSLRSPGRRRGHQGSPPGPRDRTSPAG